MKKILTLILALSVVIVGAFAFSSCAPQKETLVVYTEAGFAPFEYVKDGKIVGVDVDIMELVGKKLNKKIVFESVDFDTIIDEVASGKNTKVGSAGISVTESRKEKVNFSTEYYTASLYVIYKTADAAKYESSTTDGAKGVYWDSLAGDNVAVQTGTTADLFLGDEIGEGGTLDGTGAKKTDFTELAAAVADVKVGNSNVLIIDELPAQKLVENEETLTCAPLYYQGGEGEDDELAEDVYAIAVNKNETELLNAINEVIAELGKDGIQALVNKHLGV